MAHVMRKLNRYGDTETHWDPADKESVRHARLLFDNHVAYGGLAFEVPADARQPAEVVRRFSPSAEEIVLAPRMVGG
jgi:hypothetical protein